MTQVVEGALDGDAGLRALADLVSDGGSNGGVVVLSGAGISTESGIPDYRGETGRSRRRGDPMTYQAFTGGAEARRRYWARSHLGWRHIKAARPNAGHRAVAELQRRGLLAGVVTQNVDGLHRAAGASGVIELHGSLDRVVCLACGARTPRGYLDARLRAANPGFGARFGAPPGVQAHDGSVNPDGDAELDDAAIGAFKVVGCDRCGGPLKPDVVFFGENVPPARVADCYALTERAGALLVLGSSLTVLSGYRFVRHAALHGVPVGIVNRGPTRGDGDALVTVDAPLGATLEALLAELPEPAAGP